MRNVDDGTDSSKEIHNTYLRLIHVSIAGSTPDDKTLKEMLAEAPGPLNFTMFLSLFSDKLGGKSINQSINQSVIK